MMATVVSIAYKPTAVESRPHDHFSRVVIDRALLAAGHGIIGDAKSRADSRQLNVMLAETVEQLRVEGFKCAPGNLGEQIVISGLSPEIAVPGCRLIVGESAIIELVYFRVPCGRFARIQSQSKDAARGRLGFMARVLFGGEIVVGSQVQFANIEDLEELAQAQE